MPNYPGSLDDDVSLYLAVNNARTRLTSSISVSDLTIPVVTTSGFPNQGFVTILTNPDDITEAEAISYTGVTETSFSGTQRGAGGTPIFPHAVGNNVDLTVMAEHHNELKDAVIELEKFVGVSGSANFVPKDAQGNVVISGTSCLDDVDIKGDLTVSGTAKFGQDDTPAPGNGEIIFASQDVEQTTTSTTFTDAACETAPLLNGVQYLIIYNGNTGVDSESINSEMEVLFGATRIARAGVTKSALGTFGDAHYNAGYCHGIYRATGDGSSTVKFRHRADSGSPTVYAGAMSITCIPLDSYTQNTDYFWVETTNSDTAVVENATAEDPPTTTLLTDTFSSMGEGDWLFMWSVGANIGVSIGRGTNLRFQVDSNTIGTSRYTHQGRSAGSLTWNSHAGANIVNVAAGDHDVDILVSSTVLATADFYRGRIFAIKTSLFTQVLSSVDTTGQATSSSAFVDYSGLDTTITPSQPNSPIVVITTAPSYTQEDSSGFTSAIRNETDGIDYREDSGGRDSEQGGITDFNINQSNSFMSHFEERTGNTEYRYQFRSVGTGPVAVGRNYSDNGGEYSEMIVWEFLDSGAAFVPITQTCIDDDDITTGTVLGDSIDARLSLTVSGLAVHAGPDLSVETLTASGITASGITAGTVTAGTLTVTGTSCLDDVDVKGDLTVSGTAKFGQAAAIAGVGEIIFASQDTEQSTTSLSLVDANCETAPLLDGVEYLIIYNGYAGNSSTAIRTNLQAQFGGAKIGGSEGQKSPLGTFGDNHYNGTGTNGIYKVTGDGVSTARFQFLVASASTGYSGAMSLICIPLSQFTEGTDYFYAETANDQTFVVTNAPGQDPPNTSLLSSTFTGMSEGDWLFISSDEVSVGNGPARAFATRFQVDGVTVGPSRYAHHNDNGGASVFTFASAHVVNVAAGNIPVELLVSSLVAAEADFRRARIFAINTSIFNQVISNTDSTGFTTNLGTYQDFSGLTTDITPSQPDAPVIILTSATAYTQDSTGGVAAAIRNETDAVDYRDDSGRRNSAVGGVGATGVDLDNLFMTHFEERSSLTEYRVQLRNGATGDVSLGRNDDDTGGELSEMILWEFTPPAPFIPITNTCIDDDEIQTGTLIADTITARQELTVSGLAVHAGDPFTLQNLTVAEKLDVTGDLCVSGTAKFGQDDTPPSANGDVIFVSQDTEQTTASLTFVDANCETAPLLNGVEYLIIYAGNFGIDTESISVESQTLLGSTRIGRSGFAASALGTFGNNANNASYCHGIYRATGNGTDTVKFQFRVTSGTQTAYADAMSIICVPLDSYVQNTDYFFVETTNSDSAVVSNAAVIDPPTTVMLSNTFTSMDAGDWLFICSAEGNVSAGTTRGAVINFQVASTTIGTSRYTFQGRSFGSLTWNSVAVANMVNVAGGNTDVDILVASTQSAFADFYRGRIFAIKRSLFTQILSTADTTGAATSSSSFVDFTPLNTTIVPTQPSSPIIILTTAPSYTQQNDSGFTSALRNETDATDYRADSGGREAERGGIGSADINLANSFMAHYEERTASTEYRYQYRTVGVGPVAVGRNEDDDGGEHSEMIVWEFLNSGTPSVPITQTCIDDDQILTGTLIADDGTFNTGLTVSGVPVSTGTGGGGGGPGGDFVSRAGDSMTGNLDMQGNNVFNAGTVAMQDDIPVLTTSGLLWFDTDATGHGEHSSASLPGGFTGALVYRTTDSGIADATWENTYWEDTSYDTGGWFDSSGDLSTFTVPSGVTHVKVGGYAAWASNDVGSRRIQIFKNADADTAGPPTEGVIASSFAESISDGPTVHFAESAVIPVSGGVDVFQMQTRQESGGPLDLQARDTYFYIAAVDTRGIPGVNSLNLLQGDINLVTGSGLSLTSNSQTGTIEIDLAEAITATTSGIIGNKLGLTHSPVGLWLFDDNLSDSSGNAFDMTVLAGSERYVSTNGLRAAKLDGSTSFIHNVTGTALEITGDITVEVLLTVDPGTTQRWIVSYAASGETEVANALYTIDYLANTEQINWLTEFSTGSDDNFNTEAAGIDSLHLLTVVRESDVVSVFIDGIQVGASSSALNTPTGGTSSVFEVGGLFNTAGTFMEGSVACVKVIDSALTDEQVYTEYESTWATSTGLGSSGGGGGSGDGNITDINAQEGPSVTITGVGDISTTTEGNVITVSGVNLGFESGVVFIREITLDADASSIDFENIPQEATNLMIMTSFRSTDVAFLDSVIVRFNDDSGTNYDSAFGGFLADGTFGTSGVDGAGKTAMRGQSPTAASGPAGNFGPGVYNIPFYSRTDTRKGLTGHAFASYGTTDATQSAESFGGQWRDTSAITKVSFLPNSGDEFVAGSKAVLYGLGQTTADFTENVVATSGTFAQSLTISGVPVSTGTGGGSGDGNIADINAQEGPSITITGTAGIGVITAGNVITIDGTDVQGGGGGGSTISGCYTHIQSGSSDTWNVTHNLASVPVNYIVLDNSSVQVIPDTFTVNDSNSVTITFAVPQAGTADIFPCISGGGGSGVTKYQQFFTDETTVAVAHNIGSIIHMTTILDTNNFVIDATLEYGENTDTVTFSEAQSGSAIVMG